MVHLSRLDLNLLVVFDTVHTEGSLTAAARKLNLSQPAVSHALARLRTAIGAPLFERRGRGLVPTPLGRSLAGPVREALAKVERTLAGTQDFEPKRTQRRFRIGVRESVEAGALPALWTAIAAAGPGLGLVAARHDRARLERDLGAGEFDLALDVLLPVADRVPHERVLVDRLVVIARTNHPRLRGVGRRGAWDLDRYLALEHLQVSSRRRGPAIEDVALQAVGRSRNVRLRCQGHAVACRIVAQSDLVATVPESHAAQYVDRSAHQVLTLPLAGCTLETYMYWPENADDDPANRWLREQVRVACARPRKAARLAH